MPVWGLQHGDLGSDALERDDAVHPIAVDRRFALQLESERGEERNGVCEVIDDDAHVVHPLDSHGSMVGMRLCMLVLYGVVHNAAIAAVPLPGRVRVSSARLALNG